MNRTECLKISKKYILADRILAERFKNKDFKSIVRPALFCVKNDNLDFKLCVDDDGMHVDFYETFGDFLASVKSEYAPGDYVYVRETYFKNDDGSIEYASDSLCRSSFERRKAVTSRYAKKEHSRTFFRVNFVSLKRLYDITIDELHKLGYSSYIKFFGDYDMCLSEKQTEFGYALSEKNPYVFLYDISFVDVEDER